MIFGAFVRNWPDSIDAIITVGFLIVAFGLPLLGYVLMALDFRAYLRSLRRALVVVTQAVPKTPYWALKQRPPCLKELGLHLPITEADVLTAYRERVKHLHPDRGGDLRKFLKLQQHFEQALQLVKPPKQEGNK